VSSKTKGVRGEQSAASFLEKNGYHIAARNFRAPRGEIDIVATCGETLCFVEVKNWDGYSIEAMEIAINRTKRRKIIGAARYFLMLKPQFEEMRTRFDVILLSKHLREINHIKDAFTLENG